MAINDSPINASGINESGELVGRATAVFSVNAVAVGSVADTFAVNAVLKGNVSDGFSVEAVHLRGEVRALFAVNAAAYGRVSDSFSVEALYGRGAVSDAFAVNAAAVGSVSDGFSVVASHPGPAPGERPPGAATSVFRWDAEVWIDGTEYSQYLTGRISVEAEEGAARVASFRMLSELGGNPTDWLNQPVVLRYLVHEEEQDGTLLDTPIREQLFVGIVDHATFDPFDRTINFDCIDRLKLIVDDAERDEIDTMLDDRGYWHPSVFSEDSQGWEYAQEKLRTIGADIELDRFGQIEMVDWQAQEPPRYAYERIIENSLDMRLSNVEELLNRVDIQIDYRFTRLLERELVYNWRASFTFCQYLGNQLQYPLLPMIRSAIEQTGWHEKSFEAVPVPPSGVYCGGAVWAITGQQRLETIRSVSFALANRYSRQLIERYTASVTASSSASQYQALSEQRTYSVETEFDDSAFIERSDDPAFDGQLDNADHFADQLDRDDLEQAYLAALHLARTDILASHRESTISWSVPIEPQMERRHAAELIAPAGVNPPYGVSAAGKIRSFRHDLDLASGEATTEVSIAIRIAPGGVDEPIAAPQWPEYGIAESLEPERIEMETQLGGHVDSPPHDEEAQGFSGNHEPSFPGTIRYPYQFRVATPEIPSDTADEPDNQIDSGDIDTELVGDTLNIT